MNHFYPLMGFKCSWRSGLTFWIVSSNWFSKSQGHIARKWNNQKFSTWAFAELKQSSYLSLIPHLPPPHPSTLSLPLSPFSSPRKGDAGTGARQSYSPSHLSPGFQSTVHLPWILLLASRNKLITDCFMVIQLRISQKN